jgi:Ran GTPase-activating protein (RanGAP) involved in mRNA processing and transport
MKIERSLIEDQLEYEIMYFSPVEVGDERHTHQLYFQTDIYNRQWPKNMMDKMSAQIDQLRHVELGIHPFDAAFKQRHRDTVIFHCKMALAYLDAREARIAMRLCEGAEPASRSTESRIQQDRDADFDFLRVTTLSVKACAARRVKFYQKAVDALNEAKNICLQEGDSNRVHPLMTALTLLNLSAVLGDIDHDEHGLRWGLQALTMMYSLFTSMMLPEVVQAYYLVLACHNAALLNVKLGKWADAVELVNEGIEFTKVLNEHDDGLRRKLITIGAQAKHVPEGFLLEAVNALNGWGTEEDKGVWNLSFWDFSDAEIEEEIQVLKKTTTLKQIIIEHFEEDRGSTKDDTSLARFVLAVVSCESLEQVTIAGIDFDPRNVWRRIKKRSFLETSWYASALNFFHVLESMPRPELAVYRQYFLKRDTAEPMPTLLKKLILFLIILGNECEGVDLSDNAIDHKCVPALVKALRWKDRPKFSREVSRVILQNNQLGAETMADLAKVWDPAENEEEDPGSPLSPRSMTTPGSDVIGTCKVTTPQNEPGVTSLDVSGNSQIGDRGFELLTSGIAQFRPFKVLIADWIGLCTPGCHALQQLATTRLELLNLSNNEIGSEGAEVVCRAAQQFHYLHTLNMDCCRIDGRAAPPLAELLRGHRALRHITLNHNRLGSEGAIEFCGGAAESRTLRSAHLAYNEIKSEMAAKALGQMMRLCESLIEVNLSGNRIDPQGAPEIGSAIEQSKVLTMYLEDMGFTEMSIDDFLDHGAAETQDLQVMILNNNPVADEGLGIIAECLSIGLTDLSLSNCALTAASQNTLLNLVSLSPNLRSLDLSNNELGPQGCADMVLWMTQNEKDNFSLRSLQLANCGLGDEGLLVLVPVLSSLTFLGVKGNMISSAGLEAVMKSNQMIQLKTLDLSSNHIGETGLHALTERFHQEHKRSLWNPKQLTSTIDVVILADNPISESLAMSTEAFLKIHNPLLTVLWNLNSKDGTCAPGTPTSSILPKRDGAAEAERQRQ